METISWTVFSMNNNGSEDTSIERESLMKPSQRLIELGITLPAAPAPLAAYVPVTISGDMAFVSGQLPVENGQLLASGAVDNGMDPQLARQCARRCGINLLGVINSIPGGIDRVESVIKLSGFVASGAGFTGHPAVINGASELMLEVFGEAGRHARAAVGVSSLPLGAPVEVEAIFRLKSE